MNGATFEDRVAAARVLIDRARAHPPAPHIVDQAEAASREAFALFLNAGVVEQALTGRFRNDGLPVADLGPDVDRHRAVVVAGAMACRPCFHLRTGGPRPGIVTLATLRVDCQKCVRTIRRPVIPDDECDLCRTVVADNTFWPLRVHMGSLFVGGDICRGCAERLRFPDVVGAEP